ncbi:hypothetical protein BD779DRAFT_1787481 [Infundibulicybe gibba]|nr:hypothetical protein BD779DRAFT_1787481 [Infundibulicybe gibba]
MDDSVSLSEGGCRVYTRAHFDKYSLLKNWTNYLVANSLNQTTFISSDGQNNPNLAIKGIIGVRAMGEISQIVGQADDASRFKDQASVMLQDWENQTIVLNHITSTYGQSASWGLIYNLFSDRLLKLDFIMQKIYDDQTAFYAVQIPTAGEYGVVYDSNAPGQVKSQWTMLTAATMTDNNTRDEIVSLVHARAWLNSSKLEFPTDYNATSGMATGTGGRSSPAQGAMFAFLALSLPDRGTQASAPSPSGAGGGNSKRTGSKRNIGAIIGGALAGVAIISLAGLCFLWKCRQKYKAQTLTPSLNPFYLHVDASAAGGSSNPHSLRKGDRNFHTQSAVDSPDPNTLVPRRRKSSLHRHSRSHRTPTHSPSNVIEPSPVSVPPTSEPRDATPASSTTRNLRNEVENLRREMEEIRAQWIYGDEAPPEYE